MTEYKRIDEKQIWAVMKNYIAGAMEFIGAYWEEEMARKVAASNIPKDHANFTISIHSITLHGSMIDRK